MDPETTETAGLTRGIDITCLRGRHAGERVWLLGNGPSLNDWTPDDVSSLGGATLGINRSWQRFPKTDYHCLIAGAQLPALLEGHVGARIAFVPKHTRWMFHDSKFDGDVCFVGQRSSRGEFPCSLESGFVGAFAGLFALQLVAHLGFTQVVLAGFDARSSDGHFYAPYVRGGRDGMVEALLPASQWLESLGVEVLNANPDSAVPWWPRLDRGELELQIRRQPCGDA